MLDNNKKLLQVSSARCGSLDGEPLYLVTLATKDTTIEVTNLGASITAIFTVDRKGDCRNIVAGYDHLSLYHHNPHYFGCLIGRNAGRIRDAKIELDGDKIFLSRNDGMNHLHGGVEGFGKKVWVIKSFIREKAAAGVIMEYLSPDGDEGYPGNLSVTVKYMLDNNNRLHIIYEASTDKSTPVNLTNHSYFNLNGFLNPVLDHKLFVNATAYTENDDQHISTGKTLPLSGGPLDFRMPKAIGADIKAMASADGYNHNFVLDNYVPGKVQLAAILHDPYSGRTLTVYTDRPGIQIYTANDWKGNIVGPQGIAYGKHGAVALETQAFPDSPNHPEFPDTILHPGQRYIAETIFEFSLDDN